MLVAPSRGNPFYGAFLGLFLAIVGTAICGDKSSVSGIKKNTYEMTIGIQATLYLVLAHMVGGSTVAMFVVYACAFFFSQTALAGFLTAAAINEDAPDPISLDSQYTAGYSLIVAGIIVAWLAQIPMEKAREATSKITGMWTFLAFVGTLSLFLGAILFYAEYDDKKNPQFIEQGVAAMTTGAVFFVAIAFDIKQAVWIAIIAATFVQEDFFSFTLVEENPDALRAAGFFSFMGCWAGIVGVIMRLEDEFGSPISPISALVPTIGAVGGFVLALIGVIVSKDERQTVNLTTEDVNNWNGTNLCWGPLFLLASYFFSKGRRQGLALVAFTLSALALINCVTEAFSEDNAATKHEDLYDGDILICIALLAAFVAGFFLFLSDLGNILPNNFNKIVTYAAVALLGVGAFMKWGVANNDDNKTSLQAQLLISSGMSGVIFAAYAIVLIILTSEEAGLVAAGFFSAVIQILFFNFYDLLKANEAPKDNDAGLTGLLLSWIGAVLFFFGAVFTAQSKEEGETAQ